MTCFFPTPEKSHGRPRCHLSGAPQRAAIAPLCEGAVIREKISVELNHSCQSMTQILSSQQCELRSILRPGCPFSLA